MTPAIPQAGLRGQALREAATTELRQIVELVRAAIRPVLDAETDSYAWNLETIFPDRLIVAARGHYYAWPYTLGEDNTVTLGARVEVNVNYEPVGTQGEAKAAGGSGVFIEALAADASSPPRYLVRVIRAGTSLNNVTYPAAVLREAVPLFDGVRVFVKNDAEHVAGDQRAKDFTKLIGKLGSPRFVESANGGEIQAVLDVLETSDLAPKLREAVSRGMTDLFGLSIDADGAAAKRAGKLREATALTKVHSVDLIIEPGAGGQVIRFTESISSLENIMGDTAPDTTRRAAANLAPALAAATLADIDAKIRLIEARSAARASIAESKLPLAAQQRLIQRFAEAASIVDADVQEAIQAERDYIASFAEGAQVRGLGGEHIEPGEDRAQKIAQMFDDFFDRAKPASSFREAYIEFTGDKKVTGRIADCDVQRMREAVGERNFREAVSSGTFGNALGDSITRALVREYQGAEDWQDWRWPVDIVPTHDFRTQERIRVGGYGNLPTVAENTEYKALTTPGEEKATYAVEKRGGLETISLESVANDDVGLLRRIPQKLGVAAARTLYEFVYDFLAANAQVYDGKALAHTAHGNLGVAALDAASFAAARLAIKNQAELSSGKKLGLTLRHLVIPSALEEVAFNLFVRGTNLDETFVQSRKPKVHVVDYWTDTKSWWAAIDPQQAPMIELGFYGGREDPELFVQDLPTQGSLFTNDQIKYKIRHIYSGAVIDWRGFFGAVVP